MKTSVAEFTMKVWAISLGVIVISAITFSIYKLAVGEYCGTASFEF